MKKIFLQSIWCASIFFLIQSANAQKEFNLPENIRLRDKEDYAKYEKLVIEASIWLEKTDMDKDVEKRKKIEAFVIKWVDGTPAFTLNLAYPVSILSDRNPELLAIYIASYARNIIENKKKADSFNAIKAGLKSITIVYKKGIDVSRNKELEKMGKFTSDTQWDDYIVTTFKIPQT
jgi:hypothetical protein